MRGNIPGSAAVLLALAFLAPASPAPAQEYYTYGYDEYQVFSNPYLPYFSTGIRAGGFVFTDSETDDQYGGLGLFGVDFKLHFFDWPLAAQTGMDFTYGDGDPDIAGGDVIDSDSDLFLFNWRLSLLLEPPPGYWGDPSQGFYVQPYIGGGIGLHHADEELEVDTFFGYARDDRSETGFGYHALAGVDFVFASHFSVGVEAVYSDADFDTPISDLDLEGFSLAVAFKLHF